MNNGIDRRRFLATAGAAAAGLAFTPALAQTRDLSQLTLAQAAALLRTRDVSPVDLTQACLARIDKYNARLNAYITVRPDEALADARAIEKELRGGAPRGPLHGIPIALKDNIDTAGVRTTGASDLFRDRIPADDAEVARRLKQAGTILLGKLNLHEFAYGGSSNVTAFGTMHNPWALDRATGGSSGGPAVAVAAGLCYGSLGTDTAGSIRMPASLCGIVGLKPTYGRVSTRGVMTLSWTLDHVGPMCKSVEDATLMLNVVAGYDVLDPTTADVPVPDYRRALGASTAKLRIGIPRAGFYDSLDPEVAAAIDAALTVIRGMTASVADMPPLPPSGTPARVWAPEAYAYHSKWIQESPEKYQPGTRTTLQRSATNNAAEYAQAVHDVQVARRAILAVFTNVDLIVTPTMKAPAPPLEGAPPGGGGNNNAVFDVYGLPTISVPCGFTKAGLPIGMQISGAPWAESTVLTLAHAYERATGWHMRRAEL